MKKTPSYILELDIPLRDYQFHKFENAFEVGRKIQNALVHHAEKRIGLYKADSEYKTWIKRPKSGAKVEKLNELQRQYGLTQSSFEQLVKPMQHHFKKNINAHIAQKIVNRLWSSVQKVLFKGAKKLHYKKYGQMDSLEGKNNETGIRYVDQKLLFLDEVIKVEPHDQFAEEALMSRIKFCRIQRKKIRGKVKYYLQLVLEGFPPPKRKKDGRFKHHLGTGEVGMDIGISTIATVSDTEVNLVEFCEGLETLEKRKRILLRKMDRSRRAMNPGNYNADGTVKKGKRRWARSNRHMRTLSEFQEICRKTSAIRQIMHNKMANEVLTQGDVIKTEAMTFAGFMKTKFAKRIAHKAPSMFLTTLNRKLSYQGKEIQFINTKLIKASQYDVYSETYKKKKLSQRWHLTGDGFNIQRDCYSAFLIKHVNSTGKAINRSKCLKDFKTFYDLYLKLENELRTTKRTLVSSMGF